ncbi:MAG: hypothetical protein QNJ92_04820 [Alphaproteobacteria bacterium]|nr:hypothetical protein [Alphaproteobacteria bacterium]
MASGPQERGADHLHKLEIIQRITDLNAEHLKSEGRRGGLQVQIAGCEEALMRGDAAAGVADELDALKRELDELDQTRREIDLERERLVEELHEAMSGGQNET